VWWIGGAVGLISTGWLMVPSVHAESIAEVDGQPVTVEADRVEVDLKSGKAMLAGAVRVRRGELEVTCKALEASYDKAPSIRWAKATGDVRARMRDWEMRSEQAEYEMGRRMVQARGDVQVRRAGAWVRASEVSFDWATERMTMHKVRGSIPLATVMPLLPSSSGVSTAR